MLRRLIAITLCCLLLAQPAYAWKRFGGGYKQQVSASDIETDTTNFSGNLTSSDTDVQKVIDKFDDFVASGGGYATVQDEGSALTQRTKLNFIGAGVSCADDAGNTRTNCTITSGGGTGDVVGPASATDNALVRFDSTTGKLIQNSGAILSDTDALSGVTTLNTGQGAYELYAMDQNVLTTSSPYFASLGINKTTPAESVDIWGGDLRFSKVAKPSSAPTLATGGAGALTGNYKYCFTYYTSNGETECSTASGTYVASAEQIAVTFTTSSETITGRKIYRTQAGGSVYNLVTTIANNSATSYTDNATDASIVSAAESPTNNTTGATLMVDAVESGFLGEESTYFGFHSGEDAVGGAWVNAGFGAYALANVTTGDYNSCFGYQSCFSLTTGQYNNSFGRQSLRSCTSCDRNAAYGMGTLYALQTGSHMVAVGVDALNTATNLSDVIGIGYHAFRLKTAGQYIVGVGSNVGENLAAGEDHVIMGYLGYSNATDGNGNVLFGANVADGITTRIDDVILIGRDADTTNGRSNAGCIGTGCNPGADNAFVIGGTTPFNVGIDDSTPDHKLDVNGNIGMTASSYINFGDTDGTTGYGIRDNAGTIECKNSAGAWSACQDGTGAGGGDPVLIDGVAVSDGSGVDLIGGTNGIDIAFNAGVSPDTATFNLDLSEISAGDLANDSVLEADLKVVDAPSDEDVFTYESTTGDFEWHSRDEIVAGISAGALANSAVVEDDLAASLAFDDGDFLDLSSINASSTTEGIKLPQNTSCASATSEGQVCWDTDGDDLYIGDGTTAQQMNGTGGSGAKIIPLPIMQAKITGAYVTATITGVDVSTQGAQLDAGDGNWRLLFDATTDESAVWQVIVPDNYTSTPVIKIIYSMTSGNANEVEWEGAVMCVPPGTAADVGTASFATAATAVETVPGTAGHTDSLVSITPTDDSCAAGALMYVYISTDADDATNDDATGDRELVGAYVSYT